MDRFWTTLAIILSVLTLGFLLLFGSRNIDVTINMNDDNKNTNYKNENNYSETVSDTPLSSNDFSIDNPDAVRSPEDDLKNASISGKLCYPSSFIPPLTLYLKDTKNDKLITISTDQNQNKYEFQDLPKGSYRVFAKVKGQENEQDSLIGGYTPAVECGLTVECTNHDLIEINLEESAQLENADICDWYGVKLND